MDQSSVETPLKNTHKNPLLIYFFWVPISLLLMYFPTKLFSAILVEINLYHHYDFRRLAFSDAIPYLSATLLSLILIVALSLALKRGLLLVALGVSLVMILVFFNTGKNLTIKKIDELRKDLIAKEVAITSPNVKIVGGNLEYSNGVISFTLPSRFVLLHEADNNDNRTIFSDHSDHITMQLYDGFKEPPNCNRAGYRPCAKNPNGVEVGSMREVNLRVFSRKPLNEFYEFSLESATSGVDRRLNALEINVDVFNNQLKNSLIF